MAEDWEQYYSGFASNYAPQVTNNATTQWVTNQNQQQINANHAVSQPQQLLDYNGSYSELRGWNPDANAANNSGPALQGGSWGSVMSQNALYPETGRAMATPAQIAQMYKDNLGRAPDASGAAWAGGLDVESLRQALQSSNEYQQRQNTFGDLSNSNNFSQYPGGNYDDNFNVPYNPAGGGGLSSDEVASLYQQYLGRAPDAAGAQWAGGLDVNSLRSALTGSQEYQQSHPNPTGGATLSDMYDLPAPGAVETVGPVQNLGMGHLNDLYREYLGRDADAEGAQFWGGMPDDQVRQALLSSQEYQQRGLSQPTYADKWPTNIGYDGSPDARGNFYTGLGYDQSMDTTFTPGQTFTGNSRPWEYPLDENAPTNMVDRIYQFYKPILGDLGAKAALGNFAWESPGFNATQKELGNSGAGYGLYQLTAPDRKAAFNEFTKQYGLDPASADTQLRFSAKEFADKPYLGMNAIKNQTSIDDATRAFMSLYERPSALSAHYDDRLNYAKALGSYIDNGSQIDNSSPYWSAYTKAITPMGGNRSNPFNVPIPPGNIPNTEAGGLY